jgi:hypothetical protein
MVPGMELCAARHVTPSDGTRWKSRWEGVALEERAVSEGHSNGSHMEEREGGGVADSPAQGLAEDQAEANGVPEQRADTHAAHALCRGGAGGRAGG